MTLATNATYYGAAALYECNEHWQLDGVSRRLCQDNGTWSSEPPACKGKRSYCWHRSLLMKRFVSLISIFSTCNLEVNNTFSFFPSEITCTDPSIQIKGSIGLLVATSTLSIGGEAHYRCERGYGLQGNQTRTCKPKGQWSGAPPVCIRKLILFVNLYFRTLIIKPVCNIIPFFNFSNRL